MNPLLKVIEKLEKERQEMNLSKESVGFISDICKARKVKNFLEIGTFNGCSALCFSLVCKKVVSLEIDGENYNIANENIKKANCDNVEIIKGDAIETLKVLKLKFDIIFIDGRKSEYKKYLILSLRLLNKDGLIFVDNTLSHKAKLNEFFEYLKKSKLDYKELDIGKGLMMIKRSVK